MTSFDGLRGYLPSAWMDALTNLPSEQREQVQELRLRQGQPVTVSLPSGEWCLGADGLSKLRLPHTFVCTSSQIEQCFLRFCDDSVYAHEWELQQGYIAVAGGIRVGVAGTAVIRDGQVQSVRNVTGLCIRFPRCIAGCAASLLRTMLSMGYPANTLLVGPPSAGKTTLLRDLAVSLAAEGYRVTVVDERGELSGVAVPEGCDVLLGYPKAMGIRQAVRCLAPDVIIFDELGDETEAAEVAACARSGVAVAASLHGYSPSAVSDRSLTRMLAQRKTFDCWAFLAGRSRPGQLTLCCRPEVHGDGIRWLPIDDGGGDGNGSVWSPSFTTTGAVYSSGVSLVADFGSADELYSSAHRAVMATTGSTDGFF